MYSTAPHVQYDEMQWSLGEATCNFPMASKAIHSSIVLFARFFFFFFKDQ